MNKIDANRHVSVSAQRQGGAAETRQGLQDTLALLDAMDVEAGLHAQVEELRTTRAKPPRGRTIA